MPRQNNFQINIRTSEENFMWCHRQENYSNIINNLISTEREREEDPQYIDAQVKFHQDKAKEWQTRKQTKRETSDKFEIIKKSCYKEYKRRRNLAKNGGFEWSDSRFREWVKKQFKENGISNVNEYKILDEFKQEGDT